MGMPESEARKRWIKENKQFYGFRCHKTYDKDIVEYLEGKEYAKVIKAALREYIANHSSYEQGVK